MIQFKKIIISVLIMSIVLSSLIHTPVNAASSGTEDTDKVYFNKQAKDSAYASGYSSDTWSRTYINPKYIPIPVLKTYTKTEKVTTTVITGTYTKYVKIADAKYGYVNDKYIPKKTTYKTIVTKPGYYKNVTSYVPLYRTYRYLKSKAVTIRVKDRYIPARYKTVSSRVGYYTYVTKFRRISGHPRGGTY